MTLRGRSTRYRPAPLPRMASRGVHSLRCIQLHRSGRSARRYTSLNGVIKSRLVYRAIANRRSHERPTFYLMPAIHHPPLVLLVPTSGSSERDALNKIIPYFAGAAAVPANKRALINPSLCLFLASRAHLPPVSIHLFWIVPRVARMMMNLAPWIAENQIGSTCEMEVNRTTHVTMLHYFLL